MYILLMAIHVIISIALIMVILAQSSKGGALDGLVGGTASNVLGGQGASKFLKNATQILAVLFVLNCVLLSLHLKGGTKTSSKAVEMMKEEAADKSAADEELPALPGTEEPLGEPVTE